MAECSSKHSAEGIHIKLKPSNFSFPKHIFIDVLGSWQQQDSQQANNYVTWIQLPQIKEIALYQTERVTNLPRGNLSEWILEQRKEQPSRFWYILFCLSGLNVCLQSGGFEKSNKNSCFWLGGDVPICFGMRCSSVTWSGSECHIEPLAWFFKFY